MKTIQIPKKPITLAQAAQLFADAVNPGDQDTIRSFLNSILYHAHRGAIQGRLPTTREPLPTDGFLPSDYAEKLVFTASDIHALAKIYDLEIGLSTPATPTHRESLDPVAKVGADVDAGNPSAWIVTKPKRDREYSMPLYRLLLAAHLEGKPCPPTAREVVEKWRLNAPPEIAKMLSDGFDYYDATGNTKTASLVSIRKRIERLTSAR